MDFLLRRKQQPLKRNKMESYILQSIADESPDLPPASPMGLTKKTGPKLPRGKSGNIVTMQQKFIDNLGF